MYRYIILSLFLLLSSFGFCQINQKSSLYFDNGKLRADSTLSISAEKFEIWWRAEQNILGAVCSNLTYPGVCLRNGVEGQSIVAFNFTGSEIKNIRVVNTSNSHFDNASIEAIQKSEQIIIGELQFNKGHSNAIGLYYVPIDFALIDIRKEIKKRGAVPIIKTEILPLTNHGFECPVKE